MSTLSVAIVQADLHWHDPAANLKMFADSIDKLQQPVDLIVLPEMFSTGFTMDAESQAESMDGPAMTWLRDVASQHGIAICGSLIIRDDDHYFNRFVVMRPNGDFECYDKRHLFRLADEHQHYSGGHRKVVFELKGWRICPMICYDLRFPVWSRNVEGYDLLLYVANWPSRRHLAWQTLVRARAIENQCYVAAVNRCGTDGNELPYLGGSAIIDYLGQDLLDLGEQPGQGSANLDAQLLTTFRERFPFHRDADRFEISV